MLSTTVAGIPLDCCIYNASGPRTNAAEMLAAIGRSQAGAVLSKSATLEAQTGNPHPRYREVSLGAGCVGSINSEGLPNKGIDYYIGDEVLNQVRATGKPYVVSLSGLKLEHNLEMLRRVAAVEGIAAVELNLACPNVPGKPVIGYDFEQMDQVLQEVTASPAFEKYPLGVKLPPYFDIPHFNQAAAILNKYPIKFVVCTNTMGNALLVDPYKEETMIAPKGGFGGLGGGWVKQTALANVRKFSTLLRPDIDVVGAGGVKSGVDAFEMILCGAQAVQVGTQHRVEGPKCFNRIAAELETFMKQKGYSCLADFRGKLKAAGAGRKDCEQLRPSAVPPTLTKTVKRSDMQPRAHL